MSNKKPAISNYGIDIDTKVIQAWEDGRFPINNPHYESAYSYYCQSAISFLKGFNFKGGEFVYSDPPYLMETRRGGRIYTHEYDDLDHIELLDCLKRLPCMVMLSGYWSNLYNDALKPPNWCYESFEAQTRQGMATEYVWMNYKPTGELHDYSFLGEDFRERERIKRKKQRWVNKLQNMPLPERHATPFITMMPELSLFLTITACIAICNDGVPQPEGSLFLTMPAADPLSPFTAIHDIVPDPIVKNSDGGSMIKPKELRILMINTDLQAAFLWRLTHGHKG